MAPPALDPARQALLDETRRLVAEVASRLEGVADATRKALADSREPLARSRGIRRPDDSDLAWHCAGRRPRDSPRRLLVFTPVMRAALELGASGYARISK